MKKKLLSLLMVLVMVIVLVACGSKDQTKTVEKSTDEVTATNEEAEDAEEKEVIIGYNAFSDTVSFSKFVTDGLMKQAEVLGYKVIKADTNGDPTTALKNVDAFIAQGATVVIDSSWGVAAVEGVAKKCKENGIPMISIDIPVEDAYFMGTNNNNAGKVAGFAAGEQIINEWNGKLDYMLLGYNENAGEAVKERMYGIIDAVRESGIEISDENIIWVDPATAEGTMISKQQATDFLTSHPDSKHILMGGFNDQIALGFLSAVETSNRMEDVILVSHGADEPSIDNLKKEESNSWIGSVGYFPETYGNVLVDIIGLIASGEEVPKESYNRNVFINRGNVDEFYGE